MRYRTEISHGGLITLAKTRQFPSHQGLEIGDWDAMLNI
jgi:hypothetical protein